MAAHWSTKMFVLCFQTKETSGAWRMRCAWSENRNKLARMAAEMPAGSDPVLYNGFGSRLSLGVTEEDEPKKPAPAKGKTKGKKRKAAVAA